MKKEIIMTTISFIIGFLVAVNCFYNEEWGTPSRRHLEWDRALRDYNPGGDSSERECLYYVYPTSKSSASMHPIICIKIKDK